MPDGILNSWKEISRYAERGIRTVQRWEADYGFPVYRANDELRGSVFAFRNEIDAWFHTRRERSKLSRSESSANGSEHQAICPTCGQEVWTKTKPQNSLERADALGTSNS